MTENENNSLIEVEVRRLLGPSREEENLLFLCGESNCYPEITISLALQKITSFEVLYGMLAKFLYPDHGPTGTEELEILEQCLLNSALKEYAAVWQLYNGEDEYNWARAYVVMRLKKKLMLSIT